MIYHVLDVRTTFWCSVVLSPRSLSDTSVTRSHAVGDVNNLQRGCLRVCGEIMHKQLKGVKIVAIWYKEKDFTVPGSCYLIKKLRLSSIFDSFLIFSWLLTILKTQSYRYIIFRASAKVE